MDKILSKLVDLVRNLLTEANSGQNLPVETNFGQEFPVKDTLNLKNNKDFHVFCQMDKDGKKKGVIHQKGSCGQES